MQFRILGPLEVHSDHGDAVTLGGRKPRAVLAVLLLNANEPVSAERLAGALWGEEAPAAAVRTVHVHVSRLRKALGDGEIVTTTPAGYRLRVQPGELDAERFEQLVEQGRSVLASGRADEAAATLRESESLWRGRPLADLAYEPFAHTEIARLEEQRLAALELRVEADAAAGRHAELVSELRRLVAEHPTRERLAAQLMLVLYRCGRQTEALEVYREARRTLADEIGVEPGPELRAMHDAVLRQDAALDRTAALDLPRELEAAGTASLVGREAELSWLRDRWEEARSGQGRLVVLAGALGMGKTRLAAELALEAQRAGAAVVYAACDRPAQPCLDSLSGARAGTRPLLVIADDLDRAGADVIAAVRELSRPQVLVLATATDPEPLTALETDGVLYLKRLGSAGIGAIAALYAPDQTTEQLPVERLLSESGGVPSRVHAAASRWARVEARERVSAIAGRAAEGREELRAMEDELAGGVVQLQTARDRDWPGDGDADRVVCPFKGLASFEATDAPYFFGRERLVAALVARLVGAPLLGVVGPSGSGKSSVVRAGLLPALTGGVLPQSDDWPQVLIRPGEHPLRELRDGIDTVAGGRFVLAIDQFEETFTVCRDEAERGRFISEVVRASQREPRAVVVIAIRSDFYGRCADYPGLARLLAANHVLVGSMRREELRRAVVGPAQRAGLYVEPDLVETLVRDVEDEPGALPWLSTALLELWQRRDGRRLRLAAYDETGGVMGAVARLAEDGFGQLDDPQQAVARRVLLRLAEVEPEGGVERRRLRLDELEEGSGAVADVIGLLADARLLTVSAGTVEFAHESLLREWPRLREWIEEDREDLRLHRAVSSAAQEWRRLDRDDDALLRGARLTGAREWAERADPGPTQAEREYLDASLDCERRERRAHRRNLTIAFGALAMGIIVIGVVALVAIAQRRDFERQRNAAISRSLALQSEKEVTADPELAARLAVWALDTSPTREAATALREATLAFHPFRVLPADSIDANVAIYSPDGRHVITGGGDGRALVWDTATRRPVAELKTGGREIRAAAYSPAGDEIALGLADGTVLVTDGSLVAPQVVLHVKGASVDDLAFSGDGRRIAAALGDGTVRVVAADGSEPVQRLNGHEGAVLGVDISSDGSRVASAGEDGSVRLWHTGEGGPGQTLHRSEPKATDVAFSPNGSRIVGVGEDGRVRLWNGQTGAAETTWSSGGRGLLAAAFSADGQRVAAAGRDGITRVWSVKGGPPLVELRGQQGRIYHVGFGPASDRVVSAGDDGTVRIWNTGDSQAWAIPSVTYDLDFNHDGHLIASSSADGRVRIWDPATARLQTSLPGPPDHYIAGKFASNDDTLVITNYDASLVRLWPISQKSAEVVVHRPKTNIFSAEFDATGNRIVYVDATGRLVVRDLASGREVRLGGGPKTVYGAEFTPDGKRVVAIPESGGVRVWRIDRPARPEHVLKGHRGKVNELDISDDGRIATSGADRTVRVWDTAGRQAAVMRGNQDEVMTAVFTPDGSQVMSAGADGTLRLWDARTGAALATLQSGGGELYDVAMSPEGKIATLGKGEVVRVFDCSVCGSLDRVRALALSRSPRQLTADERDQFLAAAD
jgi:WD40 repeat protein/DNA-binding SARP family transcriptional activator